MIEQEKNLPKIMYDQSQFTPLWMVDHNGLYLPDESYLGMKNISGYAPDEWLVYTQNNPTSFWFGAYDQSALNEEAGVGFANFTDEVFLKQFEIDTEEVYKKTKKISEVYFDKFYKKESEALENNPKEVIELFMMIHDMCVFTMSRYFLTQPQRFYKFEEEIKQYLPNKDIELISTNGRYLTYVSKIQKLIIEIASEASIQNKSYDQLTSENHLWAEKVDEVVNNYGFLNWGLFGGELANKEYIKTQVSVFLKDSQKLAEESKKMKEVVNHIAERNQVVISSPTPATKLADIMGHISVLRFDLQTCMMCSINYANLFIKEVQKKYNLSNDAISSYFYDEIVVLIDSGVEVNETKLSKRQNGYLKVLTKSGITSFIAEEAQLKIKELLEFRLNEINNTKEVVGTVASYPDKTKDKVSGRAFVLTTAFDTEEILKQFKEGDILVATQTHPNLLPQMKISIAVVTDEGGITCHAAIVSRELRKPCIIGTKLGTKIFKTGDLIELNLKSGAVYKI